MDQNNAPAAGQQSEREAFEAWVVDTYGEHPRRSGDAYSSETISDHWMAWQARATLPAAAACAEQGEAVQPDHEAWGLCSRLNAALEQIGDYAHDHSTGPTVWDPLWEVRRMAYEAMEDRASLPPPARNGEMSTRKPLTEEQIILATEDIDMAVPGCFIRIARAIESAHGIGLSASCAPKQTEGDGK